MSIEVRSELRLDVRCGRDSLEIEGVEVLFELNLSEHVLFAMIEYQGNIFRRFLRFGYRNEKRRIYFGEANLEIKLGISYQNGVPIFDHIQYC